MRARQHLEGHSLLISELNLEDTIWTGCKKNKHTVLSLHSHSYKNMPSFKKCENENFLIQLLSKEDFNILIKYICFKYFCIVFLIWRTQPPPPIFVQFANLACNTFDVYCSLLCYKLTWCWKQGFCFFTAHQTLLYGNRQQEAKHRKKGAWHLKKDFSWKIRWESGKRPQWVNLLWNGYIIKAMFLAFLIYSVHNSQTWS